MSRVYRITLTPLTKFFFGGEKTFGTIGNDNYLIRSERFPQQTTLLGMLRKAILDRYGLIDYKKKGQITNKQHAVRLIGTQSFHINDSCKEQDFGIIRRLSPVFLMKGEMRYFPAPLDCNFTLDEESGRAVFLNSGGEKESIPRLYGYDPKTGIDVQWIAENGETVSEEAIFESSPQPGVWKDQSGAEDEGGYYKQYFMYFKGDWKFAFYVEIEDSQIPGELNTGSEDVLQSTQVTLGKERSQFKMHVQPMADDNRTLDDFFFSKDLKLQQSVGPWQKIILLSDAFVSNTVYQHTFFALTETVDFRFIRTDVRNTEKYANLSREDAEAARKSAKYNLLKRGSVLYVEPDRVSGIARELDKKLFRQIGYNFYAVVNSEIKPPTSYVNL